MIIAGISLMVGSLHPAIAPTSVRLAEPAEGEVRVVGTGDADPTCPSGYDAPDEYPSNPTPRCNPGRWVTTDDYPEAAINAGEEGVTSFTLSIDAEGHPTNCRINSSSGSSRLDARVCPLVMRRAKFVPAFSEAGKPVEAEWSSAIRWEIPKKRLADVAPAGRLIGTYIIEKDGTGSECEVSAAEGWAAEYQFCDLPEFEPVLNDEGQPMRVKVRIMQQVVHEPLPE
ncbi:energy transducer TonB [Pelagerythrobacter rhizovicinus]|uniref:Energy transducer TonB n=1 Tax=Pelagerythrobacter rhizovicinus TaxID=2268576 RepID=A0A4Q2KLV1_9SPHN|nr:energy transducer TonB [Pelagerythrobacter rhizovicinus]RXZ66298.1 energy transducer TonB [Pelagerythrobacter rhizovicinus]